MTRFFNASLFSGSDYQPDPDRPVLAMSTRVLPQFRDISGNTGSGMTKDLGQPLSRSGKGSALTALALALAALTGCASVGSNHQAMAPASYAPSYANAGFDVRLPYIDELTDKAVGQSKRLSVVVGAFSADDVQPSFSTSLDSPWSTP